MLFYTVNIATPSGKGPITVVDPRASPKTCNRASGKLSGAAMNAAQGEKEISLPKFGVKVTVTAVKGGNYELSVTKT